MQSLLIKIQFNGQLLSTGTGFLAKIHGGFALITNRHNVTGRDQNTGKLISTSTGAVPNEFVIVHNSKIGVGQWIERTEPLFKGDLPLWREHPHLKERADFVALPLGNLNEVACYPYEVDIGPKIAISPADPLSVIGFPFGKSAGGSFGIWATGFLASESVIDYMDLPILLVDCRTRPGQSGSPVIAFRSGGMVTLEDGNSAMFAGPVHRFIGIYSGRINSESDLGLVWKASAIQELLDTYSAGYSRDFGAGPNNGTRPVPTYSTPMGPLSLPNQRPR